MSYILANKNKRSEPRKLCLSSKLSFGKYKDKNMNVSQILKEDKPYVIWLASIWEGEIDWKLKDILNIPNKTV